VQLLALSIRFAMSERRQSIRRTVCLDDVRDRVDVQGLCQAELAAAVRALAFELRGRLGIWAPLASDEVLARVEDRLKHNVVMQDGPEEAGQGDSKSPATSVGPCADVPSPTFDEISESDVTEVPHMTDPLASAKFAMHAEVAAFQRQSERTELLRRQVAALDRKFETASTDFQRLAEEAAALAASKLEASFRTEQLDWKKELQASLDTVLEQREHLASMAREAIEARFQQELAKQFKASDENLSSLRKNMDAEFEKFAEKVHCINSRIDSVHEHVEKVDHLSCERAKEAQHNVRSALVDFRMVDLRKQADISKELRFLLSRVAKGMRKLGQVCGVLPDRMQVQQSEDIDPLDDELSGNGIEHRIDDAWAVMSEGCSDAMDLMQKKAQAMLRARLAEEVGDFDARVHRECVGLVAAHKHCVLNAAKEGLERSLPALDVVRACKQPSRWQAWSGANAEPGPNGPSERTSSSDWMSTTCPTERLGPSPALTELRSPTPLGAFEPRPSRSFADERTRPRESARLDGPRSAGLRPNSQ